jgi:DoxX-like family
MHIAFIVLSVVTAIFPCLLPAYSKITGDEKLRQGAEAFGMPFARLRLIAIPELAAAAGLLIGIWWPPLGIAAAVGMALLLIGAIALHVQHRDKAPLAGVIPAVVGEAIVVVYLVTAILHLQA